MTTGAANAGLALIADFIDAYPQEIAAEIESLDTTEALELLAQLPPAMAGALFDRLTVPEMAQLLSQMHRELFEQLMSAVDPGRLAIALSRVPMDVLRNHLEIVPARLRSEIEELMSYDPDTAGQLMDPLVISFRELTRAEDALGKLRKLHTSRLHDVYVLTDEGILSGYVRIQDLALADPETELRTIARAVQGTVLGTDSKDEVVSLFEQKKLSSVPVTDHEGRLIGVVHYNTLISAAQEEAVEGLQKMVGVSKDEKALSPALFAVRKRLPWLQINLATAFLAAAVVGIFEGTIAKVTALAVLLPVVAGQSGNTGAQALAIAIRGLTLKEIRTSQWIKLVRKELVAGLINGVAVALVTGIGVWLWSNSVGLVLVIVCSMVLSMMIAAGAGAAIPLILKSLKQDPAQSSSIVLTTVTDVVGFFSFLGIATIFMKYLPQG